MTRCGSDHYDNHRRDFGIIGSQLIFMTLPEISIASTCDHNQQLFIGFGRLCLSECVIRSQLCPLGRIKTALRKVIWLMIWNLPSSSWIRPGKCWTRLLAKIKSVKLGNIIPLRRSENCSLASKIEALKILWEDLPCDSKWVRLIHSQVMARVMARISQGHAEASKNPQEKQVKPTKFGHDSLAFCSSLPFLIRSTLNEQMNSKWEKKRCSRFKSFCHNRRHLLLIFWIFSVVRL